MMSCRIDRIVSADDLVVFRVSFKFRIRGTLCFLNNRTSLRRPWLLISGLRLDLDDMANLRLSYR